MNFIANVIANVITRIEKISLVGCRFGIALS